MVAQPLSPLRFALFFLGLFIGFYALYQALEPWHGLYFHWLAETVVLTLQPWESQLGARDGVILYHWRPAMRVVEGCDGVTVFILAVAAMLAFPVARKKRLIGVLLALPLLFALNWLRLLLLALIYLYAREHFQLFHVYLFQPMMIFATFIVFLVWLRWSLGNAQTA